MSAPLNSAVLLDVMITSESESEVSSTAAKTIHLTYYINAVCLSYRRVSQICKILNEISEIY